MLLFPAKPAFVAGRVSPLLYGRIDIDQYTVGLEECTNFIVYPHGGAIFRSGTRFVSEVENSANYARLIPFIFSNEQAYVLEFGPAYINIFFAYARVVNGSGTPIQLVTTYNQNDIDKVRFDQSGDTMYTVLRTQQPQVLKRISGTNWTFSDFVFSDGPYDDVNATTTTLTPAATTGANVLVTASAITGINNDTGFQATDVGRLIRIQHGATWGWAEIITVTDTTHVQVNITGAFGGITAVTTWRLGAWSDTTGWPEAVKFHQQRLFFARGQHIWGSKTGDFDNFAPTKVDGTVTDDEAVTYRLAAGRIDLIQWLNSGRTLECGTAGAEFILTGGAQFGLDSPLTPSSVLARKTTETGSYTVSQPIFTSRGTAFINRSGRKLMNYFYQFDQDNYVTRDLSQLSEDITYPNIFELAYQAEPNMLIWILRSDGTALACTFDPSQQVNAWHEHVLGGTYHGGPAVVESIAAIPSSVGGFDEVWMSVLRTINGMDVRYIEVLKPLFSPIYTIEQAWFVDSGLSYDGAPLTTFSGLTHLIGQTVAILADGAVHRNLVVSNTGTITLDYPASKVIVGLPYTGTLTCLPFETSGMAGARGGKTLITQKTRITHLGVLLYRTVLAKVGVKDRTLESVAGRVSADTIGVAIQPRTDFFKVPIASNNEYRNRVTVVQDNPLPCTVLSVMPVIDL